MARSFASGALLATLHLAACGGSPSTGIADADAHASDVRADATPDATFDAGDTFREDVLPYDSGSPPPCMLTAMARHILDRPGGDRVSEPSSLIAVPSGYLAGLRHLEVAPYDGGVIDGGQFAFTRDSVDILALDRDGMPRSTPQALYDSVSAGTHTGAPVLFPTPAGAFVIFQETHAAPGEPGFMPKLRAGVVPPSGPGASPSVPGVLRERYTMPAMTELRSGNLLGVTARIDGVLDAGTFIATPVQMYLSPDGGALRTPDREFTALVPDDLTNGLMRPVDNGGAILAGLTRNPPQLGFLRFDASGQIDVHGFYPVPGVNVTTLDDVATVSDAIVAVWSQQNSAGRTEVHVVVAGPYGALRLNRELENFTGEGSTVATAIPAFGGVAVLWTRGTDAATRVRAAVITPQGSVRVSPTDLVTAPNIVGRVVALADGRAVSFLARDGRSSFSWGYTFGQACLPPM